LDHKRIILRAEWFATIFVVIGLYLQSFYDFVIRVVGAVMILIGGSVLAFILGAKLGEGKNEYESYVKNSNTIGDNRWWNNLRKLSRMDDGRN